MRRDILWFIIVFNEIYITYVALCACCLFENREAA